MSAGILLRCSNPLVEFCDLAVCKVDKVGFESGLASVVGNIFQYQVGDAKNDPQETNRFLEDATRTFWKRVYRFPHLRLRRCSTLPFLILVCAVVPLSIAIGCSPNDGIASSLGQKAPKRAKSDENISFDVGVLLEGTMSSLNFPLPKQSVGSSSEVALLSSSCSCLEASVFDYIGLKGERCCGLRLVFKSGDMIERTAAYIFEVRLELNDGTSVVIKIRALETQDVT